MKIILSLFFLLICNLVSARDYFCCPSKENADELYKLSLNDILETGDCFESGDHIFLKSGNYGTMTIKGNLPGYVTIASGVGQMATFTSLVFSDASRWRLKNISVTGRGKENCIDIKSSCHSIQVQYCNIGINEISDEWSAEDWRQVPDGIIVSGKRAIISFNHIYNVRNGIICAAERIKATENVIDCFTANGIDLSMSNSVFEFNLIRNAVNLNTVSNAGIVFTGSNPLSGITIRGNSIFNYTNFRRNFIGPMAGIVSFGPTLENIKVESNLVVCDHWHGLSLFNLTGSMITNNTIVDPYFGKIYEQEPRKELHGPIGPCRLWVENKSDVSSGNIISNNLVSDLRISGLHEYESNNIIINSTYTAFDAAFMDWSHLDFRLRPETVYVHAGVGTVGAGKDISGKLIDRKNYVNAGAFQNTGIENRLDSLTIYCDNTDVEMRSNGKFDWNGQKSLKIGAASDRYSSNAFLPFVFPVLPPSAKISKASFSFNLEQIQNSPTGSVDLYALVPKKTADLVFEDYYAGNYKNAGMVRLIQPIIMNSNTSTGKITISVEGSEVLTDYLNSLIQSGIRPGDTFMLRMNHSDINMNAYSRWIITSADGTYRPYIHIRLNNEQQHTNEKGASLYVYPHPSHNGTAEISAEGIVTDGLTLQISDASNKVCIERVMADSRYILKEGEKLERGLYLATLLNTDGTTLCSENFYIW